MTLAQELMSGPRLPLHPVPVVLKRNSDETLAKRAALRATNREQAVKLAATGLTPRLIGYKIGRSKSWVNALLREHREMEEA